MSKVQEQYNIGQVSNFTMYYGIIECPIKLISNFFMLSFYYINLIKICKIVYVVILK